MIEMYWRVPLADIDFDQEEYKAVEEVLKSKWLTMGAISQQFEADFSVLTGIQHSIAVTNCTAGLHLALAALGVGLGDEVIVPSLSFVATANAVCYTGASPIFADIVSTEDLTISPASIRSLISQNTKALIVMHYGGYACDMEKILEIARERGLYVIEDAAHAVGASLQGEALGSWGDIGCFSFFPNKNMTTAEGGMVTTNNAMLAEKMRLLRSHGMTSLTWDRYKGHSWSYDVVDLGYNYRIDEIRAALGIVQLKKLLINNQKRRSLTEQYRQYMGRAIPDVVVPFTNHRGESACHLMPVILPKGSNRKEIMEKMKEMGVQTSIHYPPTHMFTYYQRHYPSRPLELTENLATLELTLPLFPGMNSEDVNFVVSTLKDSLI
jgi:dTDP-4-amino-4,6-dideoxygalactose transaminase